MASLDCIGPDGILVLAKSLDKDALLAKMVRRLAERAGCDEPALMTAIHKREDLGSTGIGGGVAIPHARLIAVKAPCGILAVLPRPIDFAAIDGEPVDVVALLALPDAQPAVALQALSGVSRCLRRPGLRAALRHAGDPQTAYAALSDP